MVPKVASLALIHAPLQFLPPPATHLTQIPSFLRKINFSPSASLKVEKDTREWQTPRHHFHFLSSFKK
jgi:hypothetical protein